MKCTFLRPSVDFLDHRIDTEGYHPLGNKVQAIKEAPIPNNVKESFLGLLNYYGSFMHKLFPLLPP